MTHSYLLCQWGAGALAGVKPEETFLVEVGQDETMTAQDIV